MMTAETNRLWQQYGARAGATLIVVLFALVLLTPRVHVRPPVIQRFGGERLPWDPALLALWDTVMRCVGLDPAPDPDLAVWVLDSTAPRIQRTPGSLDYFVGQYFPDLHAIVVRHEPEALARDTVMAHEFVHGRLRTPDDAHEAVFFTAAARCGLGDTLRFHGARR